MLRSFSDMMLTDKCYKICTDIDQYLLTQSRQLYRSLVLNAIYHSQIECAGSLQAFTTANLVQTQLIIICDMTPSDFPKIMRKLNTAYNRPATPGKW